MFLKFFQSQDKHNVSKSSDVPKISVKDGILSFLSGDTYFTVNNCSPHFVSPNSQLLVININSFQFPLFHKVPPSVR